MTRARLWNMLPVTALVVALAVAGYVIASVSEPSSATSGKAAPALSGSDLDGEHRDLVDLRGQIVLVNFWASWCAPCEDEIPVLVEAQRRYDDVTVLGVNSQDRLNQARRAARDWGADSYRSLYDDDGTVAVDWGVVGLPETFVVGRDGTILERHKGPVTRQWLTETVDPLVGP